MQSITKILYLKKNTKSSTKYGKMGLSINLYKYLLKYICEVIHSLLKYTVDNFVYFNVRIIRRILFSTMQERRRIYFSLSKKERMYMYESLRLSRNMGKMQR